MLYIDSFMLVDVNGNSSSDDMGEIFFEKLVKEVFVWVVVVFFREGELISWIVLMFDIFFC